jgi:hypothetical protein
MDVQMSKEFGGYDMKNKIGILFFATLLVLFLAAPVFAQDRATMSAPVIRSSAEQVVITVRFEKLAPSRSYRIGLGAAGDQAPQATTTLTTNDKPVPIEATDFTQGNTSGWWKVDQLSCIGYVVSGPAVPAQGQSLLLQFKLPKAAADKFDKLFVFVSRDYGSQRWYLEDGTEIDKSDW